jgi:hypothetical protein
MDYKNSIKNALQGTGVWGQSWGMVFFKPYRFENKNQFRPVSTGIRKESGPKETGSSRRNKRQTETCLHDFDIGPGADTYRPPRMVYSVSGGRCLQSIQTKI